MPELAAGYPLVILAVGALLTSGLSAVVGLAGGMTLLALMLLFMDPLVAIPLHGVVQLASNGSRAWIQRRHLQGPLVFWYALPLLPMGWLGLLFVQQIPADLLKAAIGVFVLIATWRPTLLLLGTHPERAAPVRRFLLLGSAVGFLNVAIGATGPLIAPFFLGLGLSRFAVIGTMAGCQSLGHLAKIAVFGASGFDFEAHLALLLVLTPLVVAGTWLGSRLLHRFDERRFTVLYKTVLTLIAVRLVVAAAIG